MTKSVKWLLYLIVAAAIAAAVWLMLTRGCPFRKCAGQCGDSAAASSAEAAAPGISGPVAAEEVQADLQSVEVNP